MEEQIEFYTDEHMANPLDSVEDVLEANNWVYERTDQRRLIVDVAGKSCQYRMLFLWSDEMNALQVCCQYNMHIRAENTALAASALMDINEALFMGHFEVIKDTNAPRFRYTMLMQEETAEDHSFRQIEDLVDICLSQCERYQNVFQMLSDQNGMLDSQTLSFAVMEPLGES